MNNIVPIKLEDFKAKSWQRPRNYAHAKYQQTALTTLSELKPMALYFPVLISKLNGRFTLHALMSLRAENNDFLDEDSKWLTRHIPAAFRAYPFSLQEHEQGSLALSVDLSSRLVENNVSANRFFTDDNNIGPSVAKLANFLQSIQQDKGRTHKACERLAGYGLLDLWRPIASGCEAVAEARCFHTVNMKALQTLSLDGVGDLHASGALELAYLTSFSLQHLQLMADLKDSPPEFTQPYVKIDDDGINLDALF